MLYRSQKDGAELGCTLTAEQARAKRAPGSTVPPAQQKPRDQTDLFTEIAKHFFCKPRVAWT